MRPADGDGRQAGRVCPETGLLAQLLPGKLALGSPLGSQAGSIYRVCYRTSEAQPACSDASRCPDGECRHSRP